MNHPTRLLLAILTLPVAALGAIRFDQSVNLRESPNFWYQPETTDETKLQAFNEAQGVRFTGTLMVQAIHRWDNVTDLIAIELKAAVLDSHMIFFNKAERGWAEAEAEIEFDAPILGFVADGVLYGGVQSMFAPHPTHTQPAPRTNLWSLEEGKVLDQVQLLTPTRIRVRFKNSKAVDPLRVITLRSGQASPSVQEVMRDSRHLLLPTVTTP